MQPILSFEQAPPISVPYRFFLTAPLFGVIAGLLLAWYGAEAMSSRWSPAALALTHLLAVDVMLQVMCGALLQFVAVVAGANIWRPHLVASVVHPMITAGAVFLAAAFVLGLPILFLLAGAVFALGIGFFLTVMMLALWRTPARGMTVHVLRLAVFGLLVTLLLGITLAGILGLQTSALPLLLLINVHVAWGLGGWALMLVIGVSYLVVPMFQLTPAYPEWLTRALPFGLLLVLCLWSLQLFSPADEAQAWQVQVAEAGMLLAGLYAIVTLILQYQRRRRQTDVTLILWRVAMLSLLAFSASWLLFEASPQFGSHARAPLWLGVLVFPGAFLSVIIGMLYKIVPFLNWLHLQRLGEPATMPNMKQMMPEGAVRWQMRLHISALALLLMAVLWPAWALPAGLAFAASCLLLEWNLLGAVWLYCRVRDRAVKDRAVKDQIRAVGQDHET